jgi:hypothetical protein
MAESSRKLFMRLASKKTIDSGTDGVVRHRRAMKGAASA